MTAAVGEPLDLRDRLSANLQKYQSLYLYKAHILYYNYYVTLSARALMTRVGVE